MCLKNVSSEPVHKRHLPAEVSTRLKHAYSGQFIKVTYLQRWARFWNMPILAQFIKVTYLQRWARVWNMSILAQFMKVTYVQRGARCWKKDTLTPQLEKSVLPLFPNWLRQESNSWYVRLTYRHWATVVTPTPLHRKSWVLTFLRFGIWKVRFRLWENEAYLKWRSKLYT